MRSISSSTKCNKCKLTEPFKRTVSGNAPFTVLPNHESNNPDLKLNGEPNPVH